MDLEELFKSLESKFKSEPVVIEDNSEKIMFVGDIHGDLRTVQFIKNSVILILHFLVTRHLGEHRKTMGFSPRIDASGEFLL